MFEFLFGDKENEFKICRDPILTWLSWYGLKTLGIASRLILCALPIAVGVLVYCFTAVKLKVITRSDCMLLPKGEKIAKILKL